MVLVTLSSVVIWLVDAHKARQLIPEDAAAHIGRRMVRESKT